MSTLTSSLFEDGTLTSMENDTIQDEMIEDLFNPVNFSETETCVEIMGTNRNKRGASRSQASRRSNKSSSIVSNKSKDRESTDSNAGKSFMSVPGAMSPVDEDIANMVREDVRKMIATVRSAKAQQPKLKQEGKKDDPKEKKMLVRPGKYGECDRSPRKQLLKKIRKEKVKSKLKPEEAEAPFGERRERHSEGSIANKSQRSVESMKRGYYKNLQDHGPEQVARTDCNKEKEVRAQRKHVENSASNGSVSKSVSSKRSRSSKTKAKSGGSVATSKSQSKSGEESWAESKTSASETEPSTTSPKEGDSSNIVSPDHKKSNLSTVANSEKVSYESNALAPAPAESETETGASAVVQTHEQSSLAGTAQGIPSESSVASRSHSKKSLSGDSNVAFNNQAKKASSSSVQSEVVNKARDNESQMENKKKDVESVVLQEAQTAMTESETRLEEDNSVLTGSVLMGTVAAGRGDLTVSEEDTEDNSSTGSSSEEDVSHQPSISTISYQMTQIEVSKEVAMSEEIECVLAPIVPLVEPHPNIRPDPSAVLDNQKGQKELEVNGEDPQGRRAVLPGDNVDDKVEAVPDASSGSLGKDEGEQENLRGQEAPARSSESLIALMDKEENCSADEVSAPEEEISERHSGDSSSDEITTAEETSDEKIVELVRVDDSARMKQLEIENAKLKDTLKFLQNTAVEKEKYFAELAWFGKRSEEEVQRWRPNFWRERLEDLGPELFEEFRADAMRIADPDVGDWEHGFSSGSLAMARLLLGLSHAVDDEKICAFHDPGQPCTPHCLTCSVAEQRKRELADFPVLDP